MTNTTTAAPCSTLRPVLMTDVYPTRYASQENPETWVMFDTPDGTYRSCREAGPHLDRAQLGHGPNIDLACLRIPLVNRNWPTEYVDGFVATVARWHDGVWAECQYTAPTKGREQYGARLKAKTVRGAMRAADAWIAAQLAKNA